MFGSNVSVDICIFNSLHLKLQKLFSNNCKINSCPESFKIKTVVTVEAAAVSKLSSLPAASSAQLLVCDALLSERQMATGPVEGAVVKHIIPHIILTS